MGSNSPVVATPLFVNGPLVASSTSKYYESGGDNTGNAFKKILVIYTGGTIGMKWKKYKGYIPTPNYLYTELSNLSLVNDGLFIKEIIKEYQGYESPSDKNYLGSNIPFAPDRTTLSPWLALPTTGSDRDNDALGEDNSILINVPRVIYRILEHVPLLDSSNMNIDEWIALSCDIESYYPFFDSFVVLHGTDTMAYTASALSFVLENLGKTIVFTGSQIPLAESRNDALHNFIGAMTIAARYHIPEVTLLFGNKLFRGNRTTKFNNMDFEAFSSHNMVPLAELGIDIRVDWGTVMKPKSLSKMFVQKNLNPNVSILRLFPGIPIQIVESFLRPPIRGVVLETFGAGNAPTNRPELLRLFKDAADRDVIIVNISQCGRGIVQNDLYATGRYLSSFGIISGGDMTVECAITKLAYLLGKEDHIPSARIRQLLGTSLCGELTMPIAQPIYSVHDHHIHNSTILANQNITTQADSSLSSQSSPNSTTNFDNFNDCKHENEQSLLRLFATSTNKESESIIVPALFGSLVCQGSLEVLQLIQKEFPVLFSRWVLLPIDPLITNSTLLHLAASVGHENIAYFLLQNGLCVHAIDNEHRTPLVISLLHGHVKISELIMETGGHINHHSQTLILSALSKAVQQKKINFISLVCKTNINLGMPFDMEQRTILHVMALFPSSINSRILDMIIGAFHSHASLTKALKRRDVYEKTPLDNAKASNFEYAITKFAELLG